LERKDQKPEVSRERIGDNEIDELDFYFGLSISYLHLNTNKCVKEISETDAI
jgi:hypothetical protein